MKWFVSLASPRYSSNILLLQIEQSTSSALPLWSVNRKERCQSEKRVRKSCHLSRPPQILSLPGTFLWDWGYTPPQRFVPTRSHTSWNSPINPFTLPHPWQPSDSMPLPQTQVVFYSKCWSFTEEYCNTYAMSGSSSGTTRIFLRGFNSQRKIR